MLRLHLFSPAFRLSVLASAGMAAVAFAGAQAVRIAAPQQLPSAARQGALERVLPLVFEQNVGQLPGGSAFAGRTRNYAVEVGASGLRFEMAGDHGRSIHLGFEDTKGGEPAGVSDAGFRTNEYIGNDPVRWRTGIRNFDRVALRRIYPGIDAEFYARGGEIEHDFLLAAAADARRLRMRVSGAKTMTLSGSGDVVLGAEEGALRLRKPTAYQVMEDGQHHPVDAAFAMTVEGDEAELGFKLGTYDHARALVIDPVISYATYVAGSAGSTPTAVAADASGNVYLTGYTGSVKSSFYAASAGGTADPAGPVVTTFVAKLAAAASGSQIAWVTYYGSATGSTQSAAIAMQAGGSTVYVGGAVADGGLPTTTPSFDPVPAGGATQYGFVATFAAGTGTFAAGTYVEGGQIAAGGTSQVTALAVNAAGAVTIAGFTTGNLFPTSTTPAPLIASNDPSVQSPLVRKGVVLTLDPTLVTEMYGTYICGDTCLTLNTFPTGVAVDPLGNIYLAGVTLGDFPQAGQYVAANPTATPPVLGSTPTMNMPPLGKSGNDAFAVQIVPSTQTIGYSFWSGGTGNDVATGLALNGNESDLYVFGLTSSVDLVTNGTTTSGATKSGTTAIPLDGNYPAGATTSGFVAHVDGTGQLVATTYLGGSSTGSPATATATTVSSAALDGAGNVYVAGSTSAPKSGFPQATSGTGTAAVSGEPLLPPLEDVSADSPPAGNRGFLVELPSSLSGVTYLANLGPSAGSSAAVGVAVDGASTPGANAYVLLQSVDGPGGAAFTTGSAAQQTAQVTSGTTASAYLAQIAFAAPQGTPAIGAGTDASSPNPVYYQTAGSAQPVTLTWNITGLSSTGAYGVVFNLPYNANLAPYTAVPTVTVGGNGVANVCTLGVSSVANANPGITCVLPAALLGSTTAQFVLNATLSAAATTTSPATFNVPAVAFDDEGDQLVLTQSVTTAQVPALTLSVTAAAVTANPNGSVNAALSASDTATPNTQVTYTYTVGNSTSVDSPTTGLQLNLPAAFQPTSHTIIPSNCDPTATTCDLPAHSLLVYKVTGVFLGSLIVAPPCPVNEAFTSSPSVTFGPGAPYSPVSASLPLPAISVQCNAQLSATVAASGFTYPSPGTATGFTLGDTQRTITATVTNSGPNPSGGGTVNVALPRGFTPTVYPTAGSTVCQPPTGATSPYTLMCSYQSLPGLAGAPLNVATFPIQGRFDDTGTSTDAVVPPGTSPTPTPPTPATSPTSGTVTAQVSGVAPAAGTYAPALTYTPLSVTVTRVNVLTTSVAATDGHGNAITNLNETNVPHRNDTVYYQATLTNTGLRWPEEFSSRSRSRPRLEAACPRR